MRHRSRPLSWRKKLAFSVLVLFLFALGCEVALRLIDPQIFQFSLAYHRTHSYPQKRGGLVPGVAETMHITLADGTEHFRFTLATDRYGIRRPAAVAQAPPMPRGDSQTIVHCIGDSFTMGWGVNAEDSFPEQLGERLGSNYYVLNLGVDGIGLIDSIEQSKQVASTFPPKVIVYLFSANDIDDDGEVALGWNGSLGTLADSVRAATLRNFYLANLPKAIAWQAFHFSPDRKARHSEFGDQQYYSAADPQAIYAAARSADPLFPPTERALTNLVNWARENDARLLVVLGGLVDPLDPVCISMTRRCEELDIEAMFFFSVQENLRLPSDLHLTARGNQLLAELVAEQLRDDYQIDDPEIVASRHLVEAERRLAADDLLDASIEIELAQTLLPEDPRPIVLKSKILVAENNPLAAATLLEDFLETKPTNILVLQTLLEINQSANRLQATRKPLQRAYRMQPTNLQLLSLLIKLELEMENFSALSQHLRALLKLDPDNKDAREMLSHPRFARYQ